MLLDVFLHPCLKSPTTFQKLVVCPSSRDHPTRLGPLKKANFSTLDPFDWGLHLMTKGQRAFEMLCCYVKDGKEWLRI